jgi:hypothetical protein
MRASVLRNARTQPAAFASAARRDGHKLTSRCTSPWRGKPRSGASRAHHHAARAAALWSRGGVRRGARRAPLRQLSALVQIPFPALFHAPNQHSSAKSTRDQRQWRASFPRCGRVPCAYAGPRAAAAAAAPRARRGLAVGGCKMRARAAQRALERAPPATRRVGRTCARHRAAGALARPGGGWLRVPRANAAKPSLSPSDVASHHRVGSRSAVCRTPTRYAGGTERAPCPLPARRRQAAHPGGVWK